MHPYISGGWHAAVSYYSNGAVLAVNRKPYNYYSITFC